MKFAYAFRRSAFYPFYADEAWILPTRKTRGEYLRKVKDIGFDGIELGVDNFGGQEAAKDQVLELKRELDDAGTPCVAIRAGGSPRAAQATGGGAGEGQGGRGRGHRAGS